jgi:hypothetical protein
MTLKGGPNTKQSTSIISPSHTPYAVRFSALKLDDGKRKATKADVPKEGRSPQSGFPLVQNLTSAPRQNVLIQ